MKKRRTYRAIEPDEILIDAQNLPGFDAGRLEGRIDKPIEGYIFRNFAVVGVVVCALFSFQLFQLQVVDATELKARSENNRLADSVLIAERGLITDRNGEPLALNQRDDERGFSIRRYPLGEAATHVVGYVSYPQRDQNGFWFQTNIQGVAGIERAFDVELKGENGLEIQETTATGSVVSGSVVRPPHDGAEIVLSLDAGIQKALYDALRERVEGGDFWGASGIIMDVATGEIYALASYPSFNPEIVSFGEPEEIIRDYMSDPRAPFLDRAVSGVYTPGSVVKPFVALAALKENLITPEKSIYSAGRITIPNPYNPDEPGIFRDWRAHGWTDMREAIAVSSDVYFYSIGGGYGDQPGLGIGAIESYLKMFGFGQLTYIPLEGEEEGVIPSPEWKARTFNGERWFLGNTYHTSIGQYGFQTTALQLVRATAALVDGTLVTPTLIKGKQGERKDLHLSEENLRVIREGMRMAVTEGTAQALIMPEVEVAAKTGTAEVGARKEFINSLLVGFFPDASPRFAFALILERAPAGTLVGAPATMRNIMDWIAEYRADMLAE